MWLLETPQLALLHDYYFQPAGYGCDTLCRLVGCMLSLGFCGASNMHFILEDFFLILFQEDLFWGSPSVLIILFSYVHILMPSSSWNFIPSTYDTWRQQNFFPRAFLHISITDTCSKQCARDMYLQEKALPIIQSVDTFCPLTDAIGFLSSFVSIRDKFSTVLIQWNPSVYFNYLHSLYCFLYLI